MPLDSDTRNNRICLVRQCPLHGVQIHPESLMDEHGFRLIEKSPECLF